MLSSKPDLKNYGSRCEYPSIKKTYILEFQKSNFEGNRFISEKSAF